MFQIYFQNKKIPYRYLQGKLNNSLTTYKSDFFLPNHFGNQMIGVLGPKFIEHFTDPLVNGTFTVGGDMLLFELFRNLFFR